MTNQIEGITKDLIREYLLDEGLLRKNVKDPKAEFGFQFSFPPGPMGKIMFVIKPKDRDLLIVTIGTQISEQHISALNSLGENRKKQYWMDLRKFFLLKDVFFRIDIRNHRYEISDQKFLLNNSISKNSFFKSIRKVFNSAAYSNIILGQYCSGLIEAEDFNQSKENSSGSDFSLYS